MTLTYVTKINKKPTYFIEKIWKSIKDNEITIELAKASKNNFFNWEFYGKAAPKIHTIREDKKDRWKPGQKIHNKIWTARPYHSPTFQFTPILKCISLMVVN